MRHAVCATLLACAALYAPAMAQETEAAPSFAAVGCGDYEGFADFDFWVGDWNVYDASGSFAGQNFVSKRSNGCLIVEEWLSAGGGDGTSLNFLDIASGSWRQIWRGSNNHIDYSGGLDAAGDMVLEGIITYFNSEDDVSVAFRGRWTPLADGRVIQHFTQYNDETDSWDDWFIGTYVPMADDPNGDNPGLEAVGPVWTAPGSP